MKDKAHEIINGYRQECEDAVWDLVDYIVRNRKCLNLWDVRLRCEYLVRKIDEFERKAEKALGIVEDVTHEPGRVAQD